MSGLNAQRESRNHTTFDEQDLIFDHFTRQLEGQLANVRIRVIEEIERSLQNSVELRRPHRRVALLGYFDQPKQRFFRALNKV